jgi:DNA-binding PadR family transcriptional regulator
MEEETMKKWYSASPPGQQELSAWLESGSLDDPQQDAFFLKLMLSLELPEVEATQLIQTQRSTLYRELHRITTLRGKLNPKVNWPGSF